VVEYLRGRVTRLGDGHIVFDAGGLGLRLRVHDSGRFRRLTGRTVVLPAWLDFSPRRIELYGFLDEEERKRFATLAGIPGIGPATALKLIPAWDALAGRKGGAVPDIQGVGPAKRSRIAKWLARRGGMKPADAVRGEAEVVGALRALGMGAAEARLRAARAVARSPGGSIEALIRIATAKAGR